VKLRRESRVLRIGHRGAPALAPENTLASISAALHHGLDLVEVDVIGDGEGLRLAHSQGLLRPESPRLTDALAFFAAEARGEVGLLVDLKSSGIEAEVVDALRVARLLDRALVASPRPAALRELKRLEPALATGFTYPLDRFRIGEARLLQPLVRVGLVLLRTLPARVGHVLAETRAEAALMHHALVSPRLVARCHAVDAAVLAWTVEDTGVLERMVSAGVDGVIVNDPHLFDV